MELSGRLQAPAAFPLGKNPVPVKEEAGWISEPVWIGKENNFFPLPGFKPPILQLIA